MESQNLLDVMRQLYGQCDTYRDSGQLNWSLNNRDGEIEFETLFQRPDLFLFRWSGEYFATRGDGYRVKERTYTTIGKFHTKVFLHDPRFHAFAGVEAQSSLSAAIMNDSVYSGGAALVIAPLLMPDTLSDLRSMTESLGKGSTSVLATTNGYRLTNKGEECSDELLLDAGNLAICAMSRSVTWTASALMSSLKQHLGHLYEDQSTEPGSQSFLIKLTSRQFDARLSEESFDPDRLFPN